MELNSSNTQYVTIALELFTLCGANTEKPLRTSTLLKKISEYMKNQDGEDNILKTVLDTHHNSVISVAELAVALHDHYNHADSKEDLDESFNFVKSGLTPLDSDSGISGDGFHLMEDLQTELKEKSHFIHKLQGQIKELEHFHDDAAAMTAERDSLKKQLTIIRDENQTLMTVKRDYEELCDKYCSNEVVIDSMRRELDTALKREKAAQEQITVLKGEKLTFQELLAKSKEECHRINEMYANRQCALLENNETLRTQYAELTQRHQHQEIFMQQLCREKVLLEMELKDLLNKSNHIQHHMDQSIEVSYTQDQILTQLDSLQADSRFSSENRLLDEESFLNALKEDQGRATNMSLFDEIRLSFCNISKPTIDFNMTPCDKETLNISLTTIGIQTGDENYKDNELDIYPQCMIEISTQTERKMCHIETQCELKIEHCNVSEQTAIKTNSIPTHTTVNSTYMENNRAANSLRCIRCEKLTEYANKLEGDLNDSNENFTKMQLEIERYEDNLSLLQRYFEEESAKNEKLQFAVDNLTNKLGIMDNALAKNKVVLNDLHRESCCSQVQTDMDTASVGTQAETPCSACTERNRVAPYNPFRRYLWEPVKSLFQLFAIVCFVSAISLLYNVTARGRNCSLPWRWMQPQDLMDLLFRIEYVSDVPM